MTTARELAERWTADQIEEFIANAIGEKDFKAVEALLGVLVIKDPRRAGEVWDTIQVGLSIADRLHAAEHHLRAEGEAGQSTTVLAMLMAGIILLMVVFAMDGWRIITTDRALSAAVDAAAAAGANGIDEQVYRDTGAVELDPARAEGLASDNLSTDDHAAEMVNVSISADTDRITVTAERTIQLLLVPGRTVRAGAEATPRRGT